MVKKIEYLTFPVLLLKGMFENPKTTVNNVFYYCGYAVANKTDYFDPIEGIEAAGNFLGIEWGNAKLTLKEGKRLFESMPDKSPITSIRKDILFDYYNNEKSEFEIACFLAFAALRSIMQAKPYSKTNKGLIHARMFGYRSVKEIPVHLMEGFEVKYSTRRRMDRIIQELEFTWGLKMFSNHTRGLFVSFKMDHEALARICETQKMKYKEKVLKEKKKSALLKIRCTP